MRMILIFTGALLLTACGGGGGSGGSPVTATPSQSPTGDKSGTGPTPAPESPTPVAKSISMTTTVGQLIRTTVSDEEVTVTVTRPRHGEASAAGTTVGYRPVPGFLGTDTFDYTVSSGGKSASARITVEVREPAFFGEYPFACPTSGASGPADAYRIAAHGKVHGQLVAIVRDGLGFQTRLSSDSGGTWQAGGALSVTDVTAIYFEPTSEDLVFAETTDGLWQSADGGQSWTVIDAGLRGAFASEIDDPFRTERTYVLDGTGVSVVSGSGAERALVTPDPANEVRHLAVDGWGRIFLARSSGVDCIDGLDKATSSSSLALVLSEPTITQGDSVEISVSDEALDTGSDTAELTVYVTGEAIGPGDPTALPMVPKVIAHQSDLGAATQVTLNFQPEHAGNFIITAVRESGGKRRETSNLLQVRRADHYVPKDLEVTVESLGGDRYRVTAANLDEYPAQDVEIGIWNPEHLRIQNVEYGEGSCADTAISGAYRCRWELLYGGDSVSVTFDATHTSGGPVDVHAMAASRMTDPDVSNNIASLVRSGEEILPANLLSRVGPGNQLIGGFQTAPVADDSVSWMVESMNVGDWASEFVVRGHIIARDPDGRVRPFVVSEVAVGDADCVTSFAQRPGRPMDIVSYECRPGKVLEPSDQWFISSVVPTGSLGEVITHVSSISGGWDTHTANNIAVSSTTVSEPFEAPEYPSPDPAGECEGLLVLITFGACKG
jgi:hypothetical protein